MAHPVANYGEADEGLYRVVLGDRVIADRVTKRSAWSVCADELNRQYQAGRISQVPVIEPV